MEEIEIFTDGACRGNPGLGGWGALIRKNGEESSLWGGERDTTNNRMEMEAAIRGLESIVESSNITITTDSNYLKDGITQWLEGWKKKDWKTASKKPVKNSFVYYFNSPAKKSARNKIKIPFLLPFQSISNPLPQVPRSRPFLDFVTSGIFPTRPKSCRTRSCFS